MTDPIAVSQRARETAEIVLRRIERGLFPAHLDRVAQALARFEAETRKDERERILTVTRIRKSVYLSKAEASDPFADDDCNRHERMIHAAEAHDYILDAIRNLGEG